MFKTRQKGKGVHLAYSGMMCFHIVLGLNFIFFCLEPAFPDSYLQGTLRQIALHVCNSIPVALFSIKDSVVVCSRGEMAV